MMYDIYQIMSGDTIDSIASKFSTTSDVILNLNPNSSFAPFDVIVVPTTNQYFDIYVIKKGDSLYEIARKYNTDYNLLAMLNGINTSDYIYPDTTILVPKRDVKYYFTKDNDTLFSVNKLLGSDINKLLRENSNIYLREGQLIVYKD